MSKANRISVHKDIKDILLQIMKENDLTTKSLASMVGCEKRYIDFLISDNNDKVPSILFLYSLSEQTGYDISEMFTMVKA